MQPNPVNTLALRQALMARVLGQPSYPANPMQMAQPGGQLPSGMPNTPGQPVPSMPSPAQAPQVQAGPRPGATPTQQVTKAAQQAQSPLLDQQTRDIAKTLVQKLLQHM